MATEGSYQIQQWAEYSARWVTLDEKYDTVEQAWEALDVIYEESGQSYADYRIITLIGDVVG